MENRLLNSDVVKYWTAGREGCSHTSNLRTDGNRLWSYNLLIGATVGGQKVLANYTAAGEFRSMTTSCHVGKARLTASEVVHPEFFRLSGFGRS